MLSSDLSRFTGTEQYIKWSPLFQKHFLTDGVYHLVDSVGAYWLVDAIASYHSAVMSSSDTRLHTMQIWFLKRKKSGCELSCWADTGEGEKAAICQNVEYSDFFDEYLEDEIKFYVCPSEFGWVIMLPSEY